MRVESQPALDGMTRRCDRPACSAEATVAYGFAADRQLAWLATLGDDRHAGGALCGRHADAMMPPMGWWLDDRRTDEPALFRSPRAAPAESEPPAARRRRRAGEPVSGEQLALDAEVDAAGPAEPVDAASEPVEPSEPPAEPWVPSFDVTDDLGGLLDARTPLLARAFGNARRSTAGPVASE